MVGGETKDLSPPNLEMTAAGHSHQENHVTAPSGIGAKTAHRGCTRSQQHREAQHLDV